MILDAEGTPLEVSVFQSGDQEIRLLELQRIPHAGRVYSVFVEEGEALRVLDAVQSEGEADAPTLFLSERNVRGIVPISDPETFNILRDATVDSLNRMAGLVRDGAA